MSKQAAVYFLVDDSSDKFYVGSSENVHLRLAEHEKCFKNSKHPNWKLRKAAARRGKSLSPEHVEKVRQTSKERMTPEAREHLRQVNLGIPHSPEDIERMKAIKRQNSGRPVSIEGQTFGSIAEAAEALHISHALVRKRILDPTQRFPAWSYLS